MKLGVLTNLFGSLSLDETCAKLKALGVEAVEIGCGGYPGKDHCDPKVLLNDEAKLEEFKATLARHGMELACLSAHGNPVHPNPTVAKEFDDDFHDAVLLAEKLGVDTIVTFSGCPGGSPEDKTPNWVTCPWPNDFGEILNYQWNEVLIPYWKKTVAFAREHGVTKIALEMHPGFCVYNPETLLRLRAAVGNEIGANFDPSHLIWQGIEPVAAIRALEGAIYHFHAKDTKIDKYNTAKFGVLASASLSKLITVAAVAPARAGSNAHAPSRPTSSDTVKRHSMAGCGSGGLSKTANIIATATPSSPPNVVPLAAIQSAPSHESTRKASPSVAKLWVESASFSPTMSV